LPSTIKVTNRGYVVDEVMGAVDIFWASRGWSGVRGRCGYRTVIFSGWEGAKVRYIHTVSCVELGCGVDGVFDHHEGEFFDLQAIDASNFPETETYIESFCL
jgi:hypothetical protein